MYTVIGTAGRVQLKLDEQAWCCELRATDTLEGRIKEHVTDSRILHSKNEPQEVQVWDDEEI